MGVECVLVRSLVFVIGHAGFPREHLGLDVIFHPLQSVGRAQRRYILWVHPTCNLIQNPLNHLLAHFGVFQAIADFTRPTQVTAIKFAHRMVRGVHEVAPGQSDHLILAHALDGFGVIAFRLQIAHDVGLRLRHRYRVRLRLSRRLAVAGQVHVRQADHLLLAHALDGVRTVARGLQIPHDVGLRAGHRLTVAGHINVHQLVDLILAHALDGVRIVALGLQIPHPV